MTAKIDEILQGDMIVNADENWKILTGILMELYRYHGYECEQDVIEDGGTPKRIRVYIQISIEDINHDR